MKTIFTFFACLLVSVIAMAQSEMRLMKVETTEGKVTYALNSIEEISFSSVQLESNLSLENNHEYVDLGLSVMWATCNVGANSPEEYGDYFAWGETKTKENYNWCKDEVMVYKYGIVDWEDHENLGMTKYNKNDGLTKLAPIDDAAVANWGGKWRMPEQDEWKELLEDERLEWEWIEGKGCLITSHIEGHEGAALFFPAAGYHDGEISGGQGSDVYYWSSSLSGNIMYCAGFVNFYSGNYYVGVNDRYLGCSVRPVFSPTSPEE